MCFWFHVNIKCSNFERLDMSLGVNKISFAAAEPPRPSQVTTAGGASNTQLLKQCGPKDSVCFKGDNDIDNTKMSEMEKKEMVRSARSKAAGWSIFGGMFSTLYYGLRSENKVARKYGLDPIEDKPLIKTIKTQQMLWTLPSCLPGVGLLGGIVSWLYNKNMDAASVDL